jgi:hypothetical protein
LLLHRDDFLNNNNEGLAICGVHFRNDTIHVGLFWNSEGEKKVVHFQNGNYIPVEDVTNALFQNYVFNSISDFPNHLLPSLSAVSELISQNMLNGFIFNRVGVVYNGGKFEFQTGVYTTKSPAEKFVNCAVFVIALLKTFDYTLLDWDSWPNVSVANRIFLDTWLDDNNIPADQREAYYNQTKEVRGKHIIVSPSTQTKPSPYNEAQLLAGQLINSLA